MQKYRISQTVSLTVLLTVIGSVGCQNGPTSWLSRRRSSNDSIAKRDLDLERRRAELDRYDRQRDYLSKQPRRRYGEQRRDDGDNPIAKARHTTPAQNVRSKKSGFKNPFAFAKNRSRNDAQSRDPFIGSPDMSDDERQTVDTRQRRQPDTSIANRSRQYPPRNTRPAVGAGRRAEPDVPSLDENPNQFANAFDRSMNRLRSKSKDQADAVVRRQPKRGGTSAAAFPQVANTARELPASPAAHKSESTKPDTRNPFEQFEKPTVKNAVVNTPSGNSATANTASANSASAIARNDSPVRSDKPVQMNNKQSIPPRKTTPRPSFSVGNGESTAHLPDPTKSSGVSQLSEGDPTLMVDSNALPAKSAQPPSFSNDPSFRPTPAIPANVAKPKFDDGPVITPAVPKRENSTQPKAKPQVPEIQIIPKTTAIEPDAFRSATPEPTTGDATQPPKFAKDNRVVQASAKQPNPFESIDGANNPFTMPATSAPAAPQEFPVDHDVKQIPSDDSPFDPQESPSSVPIDPAVVPGINGEADGDESTMSWWWIVLLLAAIGIGAAVHKRRSIGFA